MAGLDAQLVSWGASVANVEQALTSNAQIVGLFAIGYVNHQITESGTRLQNVADNVSYLFNKYFKPCVGDNVGLGAAGGAVGGVVTGIVTGDPIPALVGKGIATGATAGLVTSFKTCQ